MSPSHLHRFSRSLVFSKLFCCSVLEKWFLFSSKNPQQSPPNEHLHIHLRIKPIHLYLRTTILQANWQELSLDNDQIDAHLLYFTVRPLQSSTRISNIRRLNCIGAASGIVFSFSGRLLQRCNLCTGRPLTERTIPDSASIQFNILMMSM